MADRNIIGADIGTQGTKAALFSESGACLASSFRKSKLYQPSGGIVEEDPEYQLTTVCQTIKDCVKKAKVSPKSVIAIGIDGQMAGVIGIGRDGGNVTPYDSWLDTRCAPYIAKMQKEAEDEVISKTGGPPSFNHGPKILWWKHEHPKVFKSIKSFVQPSGYVAMRLCGLDGDEAYIDKSYLHFSGFADNRNNRWDVALCRKFRVPQSKMPKIVSSHDIIGELTPSMARRCGLRAGVPMVAGCGDTAASFLACGATREGICVDVAGTASVFASTTKTFRADLRFKVLGCGQAATPGLWHPYAYINGGGMNLEWFRAEIANAGKKTGKRLSFDDLDKMTANAEPSDDLPMFVPHLGGRVSPSWPNIRGAWAGLTWNHSIGHLYRAMLEGVALEYGIYRHALLSLYKGFRLKELRITGGGEKSALWNGIKANVLQTRVIQIARSEGAPVGSALLAGYGVGLFKSLDGVAGKWIKTGKVHKPDRKLFGYYQKRLDRYADLLQSLNKWSEQ